MVITEAEFAAACYADAHKSPTAYQTSKACLLLATWDEYFSRHKGEVVAAAKAAKLAKEKELWTRWFQETVVPRW